MGTSLCSLHPLLDWNNQFWKSTESLEIPLIVLLVALRVSKILIHGVDSGADGIGSNLGITINHPWDSERGKLLRLCVCFLIWKMAIMTILASFVKWVITHKTLKSCPEHGEISINYYDYYSLLSFTSRGSNMFSKVLGLWRWMDLGSKACLCLCLAAQLLARCLILNAHISHQCSRATDICSIFLKRIKWCHFKLLVHDRCSVNGSCGHQLSWQVLATFQQCLGSEEGWHLARYEDKLSDGIGEQVFWVSSPEKRHQVWVRLLRKMSSASLVDVPMVQEGAVLEAQGLSPGR